MLPNFILAGVEKTGSTSLYEYLSQHPDVFMSPVKEPEYFIPGTGITDIREYESLFDGVQSESAVGEASVGYFHSSGSARRIKEQIPEGTILLFLRDPAERAFSHYNMLREHGEIPNRPFIDALREARKQGTFKYTGIPTSRYASNLKRYRKVFGNQLHIYLHRNLKSTPRSTVREVFRDIGVDPEYSVDTSRRHNKTKIPKSSIINRFLWGDSSLKKSAKALIPKPVTTYMRHLLTTLNREPPSPLSDEARRIVIDELREDIEETEKLIGRDLSEWKE